MKKPATAQGKVLSAERLDELHDAGGDMTPYMDESKARRPGREIQRVNVDFPVDLLHAIDREATRIGVTSKAGARITGSSGIRNTLRRLRVLLR